MPYVAKVTIRGFQSHVDSNFQLAPGLTVITGPSDAGKTAVIRALRWLAFNEPTGDAFLHTLRNADGSVASQADQAEVLVEFDDGTVIAKTRRKGKTTYTHSLYPEPWEKAEVPQEIKDTLGLLKQTYGDNYETCLNFAFQLDAPFLLSEAGSVGAKVLGKLAGTEVVDKAIGAVTKSTHRTREDRARAEKTVGQLDVELLEYLGIDEQLTQLEGCEDRFAKIDAVIKRYTELFTQLTQYSSLSDKVATLTDKLDPLTKVPYLVFSLDDTVTKFDRRGVLETLDSDFWKGIKVCKTAKEQLKHLEGVQDLQGSLQATETSNTRYTDLVQLNTRYVSLTDEKTAYGGRLAQYSATLAQAEPLESVAAKQQTIDQLFYLLDLHNRATSARNQFTDRLAALEGTQTIQAKIDTFTDMLARLDTLRDILQQHVKATVAVGTATQGVEAAVKQYADAEIYLKEAWDAAGGICPLCEQPIRKEVLS